MNKKTFNKIIKAIENLDWNVEIYDKDIYISQYSPLGEDFGFSVNKENMLNEILEYTQNYDYEDHASLWIENRGKNGIPSSIQALLDDARDIGEMLEKLEVLIYEIQNRQ